MFRQRARNSFLIDHLKVRQQVSKNYFNQTNSNDKYVSVKESKEAKKIFENTLKKAIYDRLQKVKINKKKIMMKIKSVRRIIEELIKKAYVIAVFTQQ